MKFNLENIFDFVYIMERKSQKYENYPNAQYFKHLIAEATLEGKQFGYRDMQPCVFFWKELVHWENGPKCLVPDTLILNEKESPLIWIYCDKNGKIAKTYNVSLKDFVSKVTSYSSPNELVAILKRPTYNQYEVCGNQIKLLNSRYLQNCSMQQLANKEQIVCLQRYVKSNGGRAYICRTIWKKAGNSNCYIITSKKSFNEQNESEMKKFVVRAKNNSNIVKSSQGRNLKETSQYLENIAQYFHQYRGKKIKQIIGDFIKDQAGNWWLVNIKAFKIDEDSFSISQIKLKQRENKENPHDPYEKQKYQKTKICRYCEKNYLESQLKYNITIKMLIEIDRYLLHLGKDYKWLMRSDVSNVDSYCLYQQHKICERCYKLYLEIQQLLEIQRKFSTKAGNILEKTPKQLIQSSTNSYELSLQSKNKQIAQLQHQLPETIELGPKSNIIIKENHPIRNDENINKMYRYRVIIYFREFDQICQAKRDTNYYLQYTLLGNKTKTKIDINPKHSRCLLQKLKILYFFAHDHQELHQYAQNNPNFTIFLVAQNKKTNQKKNIGSLVLSLKDYFSAKNIKKDFYKMFNVNNVPFGWGLEGSIGVITSPQYINTSRLIFTTNDKLIYRPSQNYYCCQSLPEQWLDRIKLKPQDENRLKISIFNEQTNGPKSFKNGQTNQQQIQNIQQKSTQVSWKSVLQKQMSSYMKRGKVRAILS